MIDHDGLFKQLLTKYFLEFIELFLPELSTFLSSYRVKLGDKEVYKELFGGKAGRADLVAEIRDKKADILQWILHIEIQSQGKTGFQKRMFDYFCKL